MPHPIEYRIRTISARPGWFAILMGLIAVIAIGLIVAVVAIGMLVILVPAMLILTALYYLFPGRRLRPRYYQGAKQPTIIDGEFRILEPREIESTASEDDPARKI